MKVSFTAEKKYTTRNAGYVAFFEMSPPSYMYMYPAWITKENILLFKCPNDTGQFKLTYLIFNFVYPLT